MRWGSNTSRITLQRLFPISRALSYVEEVLFLLGLAKSSFIVAIWPCQTISGHPVVLLKCVLTHIDWEAQEHEVPRIILNCSIHFSLSFQGFGKSLSTAWRSVQDQGLKVTCDWGVGFGSGPSWEQQVKVWVYKWEGTEGGQGAGRKGGQKEDRDLGGREAREKGSYKRQKQLDRREAVFVAGEAWDLHRWKFAWIMSFFTGIPLHIK